MCLTVGKNSYIRKYRFHAKHITKKFCRNTFQGVNAVLKLQQITNTLYGREKNHLNHLKELDTVLQMTLEHIVIQRFKLNKQQKYNLQKIIIQCCRKIQPIK